MRNHTPESLLAKLCGNPDVQQKLGAINAKHAEHYAMKLGNMLVDASTVALSKHGNFGIIDAEVQLVDKSPSSVVYNITLNDANTLRPSISNNDNEPVNMLDEFNYGWCASSSFVAEDRHGNWIRTRRAYTGELFLQDACIDFNNFAPEGIVAYIVSNDYHTPHVTLNHGGARNRSRSNKTKANRFYARERAWMKVNSVSNRNRDANINRWAHNRDIRNNL